MRFRLFFSPVSFICYRAAPFGRRPSSIKLHFGVPLCGLLHLLVVAWCVSLCTVRCGYCFVSARIQYKKPSSQSGIWLSPPTSVWYRAFMVSLLYLCFEGVCASVTLNR